MPASKKSLEQKPETSIRVAQIIKEPMRIDCGLLYHHKHDNYYNSKLEDSSSNNEANLNKISNLFIG